ncbi:MAG: hypothetical protein J0H43_04015, partial [Actinobacteria bacterium]|nr:hypothetical protein [Actinomycetota bacterium]
MTLTEERVEPSTAGTPAPEPTPPATPRTGPPAGALVALSLGLAAALVLGFFAYLLAFSGVVEGRAQHAMLQSFARQLRDGIAPVGPVPAGTPVA